MVCVSPCTHSPAQARPCGFQFGPRVNRAAINTGVRVNETLFSGTNIQGGTCWVTWLVHAQFFKKLPNSFFGKSVPFVWIN